MKRSVIIIMACIFAVYMVKAQEELVFNVLQGTFTDKRDGQVYKWVKIGSQIWMAENLNYGKMLFQGKRLNKGSAEKLCYDNDEKNCDLFGGLYPGYTMDRYYQTRGAGGICPEGWHVPSDKEWDTLVDFLGGKDRAGGAMKETGTTYWNPPNTGATDSSGFSALPGGYFDINTGDFVLRGKACFFWSSTLSWAYTVSGYSYWNRNLNTRNAIVRRNMEMESSALSVRCVKD